MRDAADVVVAGGGIVGAAVAYFLMRRGARSVALIDPGLGAGATAQSGGIVRLHHSSPAQMRLAWKSRSVYANWADEVGGTCGFRRTGFAMIVGPQYVAPLRRNAALLRSLGCAVELLGPAEFAQLQPCCDPAGIGAVAFEPDSGYADPLAARDGFVRRAVEQGLVLVEGAVTRLVRRGETVVGVSGTFGTIAAGDVVLAASVAVPGLLEPLGVVLPVVTRAIHAYHLRWAPAERPLVTTLDDTIGTYYKPTAEGAFMLGAGTRERDVRDEPAAVQRDHERAFTGPAQRRIPALRGAEVVRRAVAAECYTPDKLGIVGRVTAGLYLAFGFSGGGFKTAPAVGMGVATELLSSWTCADLAALRPARFGAGEAVRPAQAYAHG